METKKAASHPDAPRPSNDELVALAAEVCHAIEACGASPELTRAVSLSSDLATYLRKPDEQGFMPIIRTPLALRMGKLNEKQAQINHGQSLSRLAERGGLSPAEALAIAEHRRFDSKLSNADALSKLAGI